MSKGIAIDTIILLVIGIIVVGILVYLVYKYTSGSSLSLQKCSAELQVICNNCKLANWSASFPVDTKIRDECAKYPEFSDWTGLSTCGDLNPSIASQCKKFGVT